MKFNAADATVIALVIGAVLIIILKILIPYEAPEMIIEFYKNGEKVTPIEGEYDVKITQLPVEEIKEVEIRRLEYRGTVNFEIEEIEKINIEERPAIQAFVIASNESSESITIKKTAKGNELRKCIEWDFENKQCIGRWQKILAIKIGEEYELDAENGAYAEIIVLNPVTYLRDNENWIVSFLTFGKEDLIIESTNANWEELLKDNPDTFDEMRFLDLKCGDITVKDRLKIIDFGGNEYNYNSIRGIDSIKSRKFIIENYECKTTSYLTDYMNKAGYAIIKFTFGSAVDYAIDPSQFEVFHNETNTFTCSNTGGCNALQLLFKPTTTGAYVIFASGSFSASSTDPDTLVNVTINTTSPELTIGHAFHDPISAATDVVNFRLPINTVKQVNLTADNIYNISMSITPSTAVNAFLEYARIVVFNPNVSYYTENDTRVTTTGTDDVQFLENNFTVTEAGDYLVLWSAVGDSSQEIEGRLTVRWNGSATASMGYANYSNGADLNEKYSLGGFFIQSMAAGAHKINVSFTRVDASAGTIALQQGRILVMPLSIFQNRYFASDNRTTTTNSNVSYVNNTYTPTASRFHIKFATYQYEFGGSSGIINVTVWNRTDPHAALSSEVVGAFGGTVNARSSLFFWGGNLTGEQNDTLNSTRAAGTDNVRIREARLLALELPVPFSSADATPPTISFVSPTPANGTYSVNYVYVNITATDSANIISNCTLEWNGVNETMQMNSSVNGLSRFCFVNKTSLSDGNYSYRVFANDSLNNTAASATRHAYVDTTAPTVSFVSPTPANGTYSVNYVYVNVTATDASNIINACILEWNGVNETMAMNSSINGVSRFCFVNKTGLSDGNYSYRVFANDSLNNSAASATRHAFADTTAPTVSYVSPTDANGANVSRNFVFINITASDAGSNMANCILEWNGVNESMNMNSSVSGRDRFCWANKTSLSDSTYTYRAFANDTLNNTATAGTRTITIDTTGPTVSFVSPTPANGTYGVSYVYVNVTATDSLIIISSCNLEWNGVNESMTMNSSVNGVSRFCSVNKTGLGDGNYSYRVFANDSLNNTAASATRHVNLDTVRPVLTFQSPTPANGTYSVNFVYVNMSVNDTNAVDVCTLEWNGINESMTKSGTGTNIFCFVNKTSLSNANYTYRVFANDSAGNLNVSATRHANIATDSTPPTISFVSPTPVNGTYSVNYVYVNVTATDASNIISACILEWNGVNETMQMNGTVSGTSRFCFVNKTGLTDGNYSYRVFANDSLNNTAASATRHANVDTAGPVLTFQSPTPVNNTYTVSYVYVNMSVNDTSSSIDTCTLEWNGVNESMTMNSSVNGVSRFCFVNKTGLSNANYSYRVFANDTAGNLAASATRHANINVPPPPPIIGVVFSMEFNISGSANDAAEVDNQGTGHYNLTTSNFNNYYACEEDTSLTNTPTFALVFAGTELNYINLTSGNSFRMQMSQKADSNKFLIAVTRGGCDIVRNAFSETIKPLGAMTHAFVEFITATKNPIEIALPYANIDIVGDLVKSGAFTLNLEKNESAGVTQIIFRE